MPGWVWVLIVVAAVVVLAAVVWRALAMRRTRTLQDRFGPEYNRTLESSESKRDAESELRARAERREQLDIHPLTTAARDRYVDEWQRVQALFVDDPQGAVHDGDMLIQSVMRDRGYPVDDFEQRSADVSVDHPRVVENYRQGHRLANAAARGDGTTEDLRQAMRHYRALFEELVDETAADAPMSRDAQSDVRADDDATVSRRG
jgi:type VI protein secretion system component VasK